MLSPVDDVLDTLAEIGINRSHLVGASFGAAVAVETALTWPRQVASLLLSPPGGSLIAELTPDLRAFIETENAALARGDLGDAVEANLTWWVDGPRREAGDVDPTVRELVRLMQRRAFEVTAGWDDIEERELDPAAIERLAEIRVPTLGSCGLARSRGSPRSGTARGRRNCWRAPRQLARRRPLAIDGTSRRLPRPTP
jgi:3-oxoadipate enol-lactonase